MKKGIQLSLLVLLVAHFFISFEQGYASEIQNVETKGNIGFTGVYEPIGTPDPIPPESIVRPPIAEVAKPGQSLPQTNTVKQDWLMWLGALLISLIFLIRKRKNKKQMKFKP